MQLSGYSKVWAFGHMQAQDILDGEVIIQEKVDGSQFSFGNRDGQLLCRSKGAPVGDGGNVEGLFAKAYRTAELIMSTGTLPDGMVVRGECVEKPKHNTLQYGRVPVGNLVIWDISLQDGSEIYLPPERVTEYAVKWGLEVAPLFHYGPIGLHELQSKSKEWLARESFLGNCNIEGFVIKNNKKVDGFGKRMAAKIVAQEFKEQNSENWKAQKTGSVIEQIIASFRKEQIWEKAIQHAKEDGLLLNEPKDIGYLIGSVKKDFGIENGEAIKKRIFKEFYSDIERGIMRGFPEYYKQRLLNQAFEGPGGVDAEG